MKILHWCYFAGAVLIQVHYALPHPAAAPYLQEAVRAQDVSLLQPSNVAYVDAMEFARFLTDHGLVVRSVHRSHLEGFFQGIGKAAFFRTDKGIVEVAFFPGLRDAERVSVTYSRNGTEVVPHRYKVAGQPVNSGGVIEAAYPVYFTMHKRWYIVTSEAELDAILKRAVGQDRRTRRQ